MSDKKTRFDGRVSNGKEEWLTPLDLVKALGEFDLDPCSAVKMPWDIAKNTFSLIEDGLSLPWYGRVFLNPPYGNKTGLWMSKMAEHNRGIALIFARTETRMFFDYVWNAASALYFIRGRISFYNVDGTKGAYSGGAPSVLIAYGEEDAMLLKQANLKDAGYDGKYIPLVERSHWAGNNARLLDPS